MISKGTTESNWCVFGITELTFYERYKQAKVRIAKMTDEEKRELIEQSWGMWADRNMKDIIPWRADEED